MAEERRRLLDSSRSFPDREFYGRFLSVDDEEAGPSCAFHSKATKHRSGGFAKVGKVMPKIVSSFMPIPSRIPVDFDNRITVLHVASAPRQCRGGYGSIRVQTGREMSQKKPADGSIDNELKLHTVQTSQHNRFSLTDDNTDTKSTSSSSGSSSSSSSRKSSISTEAVVAKRSSLTTKEWITIGMLSTANFGSTITYSCIAPFYPNEAKSRSLNTFETGIVFGVFEFVMFIMAPLLGKFMVSFGSKRMFIIGIALTGITAILFGFLNFIQSSSFFFWSSIAVRIAQAVGDAAFVTSSFAIGAKCFPRHIATIIGLVETFAGLGFTAGPPLGGILYELGGFQLPFFVLGILLLFVAVVAHFLVENVEDDKTLTSRGVFNMLKIPLLWIMIYAIVVCAISLSFLDPTLANHLESFNLSPSVVGLLFLLCGGIYTITAPFWGIIIDKYNCNKLVMFVGAGAIMISMILIGPAPFLKAEKDLVWIAVGLGILGLATGALYIPTFQTSIDAVRKCGYDESLQTYGCVAGLFQSAFSFGSFFGPTVGSLSVVLIGFSWTTMIIALFSAIFIIIISCFYALCDKTNYH